MPPRLLNADPLAQIISTDFIADVIINDTEACALLDSRAMVNLMSSSYAKARIFYMRPITELSDCFVNLNLQQDSELLHPTMLSTTSRYEGSHPITWIELP